MPDRQGNDADGVLPKLTIGQRVLAALPSLQRDSSRPRPRAGAAAAGANRGKDTLVRPDAVIDPGSRTRDSARQASPGQKANPYADMSVAELREKMKRLDDRERSFALLVAPLLAVLDILLTLVALHDNPAVHVKGHADTGTIVFMGVGSAIVASLVVVAALLRRRSLTAFALLIAGYGGGIVTLLPAWILAGWLFVRFNKMQKVVVAKSGGPAAARQAAAQARRDARRSRRDKEALEPAAPSASKRYTPPKPARSSPTR